MVDYREILAQIDESLAQEYIRRGQWYSVITQLMKEFLVQHPEKKNEARDIFYANADEHNPWDWTRLYLSIFNDKESYLKLIDDERFYFGKDVLKSNQEPEVVAKVLEKTPALVIDFLQAYPDKKEEYKPQALRFFDKEIVKKSDKDYRFYRFFSIYKNDTALWLDILDERDFDKELYQKIIEVCHDEEVINEMLDKLAQLPETKDVVDIYYDIVRVTKDEEVCRRILEQTDNASVVNRMALDGSNFSNEFKDKILHHPNLSYFGWWNGPQKYMPDSAFDDEIFEQMLRKIPAESYTRYTETTINNVLLYILKYRANPEFAQKVFACCQKIEDYGSHSFSHYYEEDVLLGILKNDQSDRMFQRMFDYAVASNRTELFDKFIEIRPTADIFNKIKAYYEKYYREKAEAKAKMKSGEKADKKEIEKEFDYVGYYEKICQLGSKVSKHTDDLGFLDEILAFSEKLKKKAQQSLPRISSLYDRYRAKNNIEMAERDLNEAFSDGYIRKKLKQMYPKLSFEEAVSKAFKQMLTMQDKKQKEKLSTILNAEGFDFYVNYLKNAEGKICPEILDYVLKEKEIIVTKLPQYDGYKREELYRKIKNIESDLEEKGIIRRVLGEKYPDLSFEEALIREAARVVKFGDENEKMRFNNILLAEGEQRLLNDIDEKVCNYLVNNFTAQNLDDVNALRSFYGLKIIIDETPFETPNLRTVRRMQFEDVVRPAEPWSEYYEVQFSDAYRNFVPDKRRRFKESDYYDVMDRSEAFQILFEYGYSDFAYLLPNALAELHVPPEVAAQFNIKDLQAVFYAALPDAEKDVYGWDGDFLFTKNRIELKGEYDTSDLEGARQTYWMDVVNNKQLVRIMKDDLLRHGISDDDVSQLFQMAEDCGYPNAGRKSEKVSDVIFSLHHVLALKDGGLNYPSNYAPTCIYELGHNSHAPLHRYDTPKDIFYVVEGAKLPTDVMLTMKPQHGDAKKVRIRTIFTDDEINPHKKVLFYGGARKCSRYVGRLHNMENIALKAKAIGKEQKRRDAKMKMLVQIVFKNVERTIEQANERMQQRYDAKKRQKIEKRKQTVSRSKKGKAEGAVKGDIERS